jgi:hypothetical protein
MYKGIKPKYILAACIILVKNSLSKGNNDVIQTLKDTKHPKDKTFDKIYAMMLEFCSDNLEDSIALKVNLIINEIKINYIKSN